MHKEIVDLLERVLGKINMEQITHVRIDWDDLDGLSIEINTKGP